MKLALDLLAFCWFALSAYHAYKKQYDRAAWCAAVAAFLS